MDDLNRSIGMQPMKLRQLVFSLFSTAPVSVQTVIKYNHLQRGGQLSPLPERRDGEANLNEGRREVKREKCEAAAQ